VNSIQLLTTDVRTTNNNINK